MSAAGRRNNGRKAIATDKKANIPPARISPIGAVA
jgi:hypothetical protein